MQLNGKWHSCAPEDANSMCVPLRIMVGCTPSPKDTNTFMHLLLWCYPPAVKSVAEPWLGCSTEYWSVIPCTKGLRVRFGQGTGLDWEFDPWLARLWEAADCCFSVPSMFFFFSLSPHSSPFRISELALAWRVLKSAGWSRKITVNCLVILSILPGLIFFLLK